MLWTARQRGALTGVMAGVLLVLFVRYAGNRAYVDEPQPAEGARAWELMDRIDPNEADWAALAALPAIGEGMAKRIVEERAGFRAAHRGQEPYTKLEDLLRVKGIGPATLQAVEPYLIFPAPDRPAAQP